MRYYLRKPDGAIMTTAEFAITPFGDTLPGHIKPVSARFVSFGGNYFVGIRNAYFMRESLGDGYRVVAAESQPPDHETRYFIRKPNGHLIADVDDARQYFTSAGNWHPNAWSGGFVVKDFADGFANKKPGFAVVPREMLTGRDS